MNTSANNAYLQSKVLTATPEQLQLMLYDGAIRFCEQARPALEQKNFEASHNSLTKAQRILLELQGGLKKDLAPDICKNLAGLYAFCYRKLIDANMKHDVQALDEALDILKFQRETWRLLLDQLAKEKAAANARRIDMPAPDARMEASISLQG